MHRDVKTVARSFSPVDLTGVDLQKACIDVLASPTVASKRFLITIGDRTVGGLSHRDQMVGPWQVPVADVAVTLIDGSFHTVDSSELAFRIAGRMALSDALAQAAPGRIRRRALRTRRMPSSSAALLSPTTSPCQSPCGPLGTPHRSSSPRQ